MGGLNSYKISLLLLISGQGNSYSIYPHETAKSQKDNPVLLDWFVTMWAFPTACMFVANPSFASRTIFHIHFVFLTTVKAFVLHTLTF